MNAPKDVKRGTCINCGVEVTLDDRAPQWAGGAVWCDENVLDYDNNGTWCEVNEEHEVAS